MSFDYSELVTDRAVSDSDTLQALEAKGWADMTAQERQDYTSARHKGAYDCTDINRVQAAMDDINSRLTGAGYITQYVQVWAAPLTDSDSPRASQLEAYRANVQALRDALTMPAGTPDTPETMRRMTYKEANDIERILLKLDASILRMIQSQFYCGELYAGEG